MAMFSSKGNLKYSDNYMTPKSAWLDIQHLIPKDKVIWEAFYGDGKSGTYLTEMGFDVIHDDDDFFESNKGDVVVSNPPFSKIKEVLIRLKQLDKPFILILPSSRINTQYVRDNYKNQGLQIVIPIKRIHFEKKIDGKTPDNCKSACNFDCFYYCYKMKLPNDITWLK